jgi:hypothetical protein
MPRRHSEDRIYTVMSGVFFIGVGDQFDDDRRRIRSVASSSWASIERTSGVRYRSSVQFEPPGVRSKQILEHVIVQRSASGHS